MAILTLVPLAAETAHESEGVNPWLVGVGSFAVLVAMLLVLVAFGGGRDHT
jgi:hypothetical protein